MEAPSLTFEQNSVVNAVWTLINSMDEKMRNALISRIESGKAKNNNAKTDTAQKHSWYNIPISDDVMSMTFKQRKPIEDYKGILEKELKTKYV